MYEKEISGNRMKEEEWMPKEENCKDQIVKLTTEVEVMTKQLNELRTV